ADLRYGRHRILTPSCGSRAGGYVPSWHCPRCSHAASPSLGFGIDHLYRLSNFLDLLSDGLPFPTVNDSRSQEWQEVPGDQRLDSANKIALEIEILAALD